MSEPLRRTAHPHNVIGGLHDGQRGGAVVNNDPVETPLQPAAPVMVAILTWAM